MLTDISPAAYPAKRVANRPRFHALDALRGLAAITVVLRHFTDLLDRSHDNLLGSLKSGDWKPWEAVALIRLSPLGFAAQGHSAVIVFFVLSGFVLTLPFSGERRLSLPKFIAKRIIRLWIPFIAALFAAICADAAFSRHGISSLGAWFNQSWISPITWHEVFVNARLALGTAVELKQFNVAYWSLAYELNMAFVFPFLLSVGLRLPWMVFAALSVVAVIVGDLRTNELGPGQIYNLTVAGLFGIGVLLAKWHHPLRRWYGSFSRFQKNVFLVVALELTGYGYLIGKALTRLPFAGDFFIMIGASILVLAALADQRFSRFLNHPVCLYLGKISYSLYLLHLVVLFSLVYLTYENPAVRSIPGYLFFLFVGYLALSISLAQVFYVCVEKPSIKWAQKLSWYR